MSKYNNMISIAIDSIPKEEISRAIKEWAEGDNSMERLLWTCYDKGIKTNGCHAGARPYISFAYQDNLERIIPLFEVTQEQSDSQILIQIDGGNPFSGTEWYIPSILFGINSEYKGETDEYLDKLNESLNIEDENKSNSLLNLLEFLLDKESALLLRFVHDKDNRYHFMIESHRISDNRYRYYNELFKGTELVEENLKDGPSDKHFWTVGAADLDDILLKIESISKYIINNYSYDVPQNEEDAVSLLSLAKFKRRTLSEEEFDNWLNQKRVEYGLQVESGNGEK